MISHYSDFVFCSKWVYPGFYMVRDAEKLLTTKQYYTGQNMLMHKHPYIHASAIEAGFKSEKVSHMIEALLEHRT